jgi:hypothetical protein
MAVPTGQHPIEQGELLVAIQQAIEGPLAIAPPSDAVVFPG